MSADIRKIALAGLLIALAFGLSYVEYLLPLQTVIPIPGIKLGLANIVTMFALCYLDKRTAFLILCGRCILQAAIFGTVSGLIFSLSGGICAFLIMSICMKGYKRCFSIFGISMAGAAAHQIGQVGFAAFYFRSVAIISYLPVLLLISVFTGLITGLISRMIYNRLDRIRRNK